MSLGGDRTKTSQLIDELRQEIADVNYTLNATKVELQIVQERLKNQESSYSSLKNQSKNQPKADPASSQLTLLEKRLFQLEKNQEKLSTHANQTSSSFVQYRDKIQEIEKTIDAQNRRLEEVVKLKATLSSISNVMQKNPGDSSGRSYRVKPGDSLEKIARTERVTVEAIKTQNSLENDRIVVGQELKIP
jgi:LysM repeat protein